MAKTAFRPTFSPSLATPSSRAPRHPMMGRPDIAPGFWGQALYTVGGAAVNDAVRNVAAVILPANRPVASIVAFAGETALAYGVWKGLSSPIPAIILEVIAGINLLGDLASSPSASGFGIRMV